MRRWKKQARAVSHSFRALGTLEIATNWALLVHNFSNRCLKMSDTRWKARRGTPACIYARHHSLLSFFTRNWTRNQDSGIMYLCADALSLDGRGDERDGSQMYEKPKCLWGKKTRFSVYNKNSFEHEWQLNVFIKPSLKETCLRFTLPSIPCVLEYAENLLVYFQVNRNSSLPNCG